MSDTEREEFEIVCPLPDYLRWTDTYYENILPDEKRTEESDRETDAFNSCYRGFSLGREQIAALTAERDAALTANSTEYLRGRDAEIAARNDVSSSFISQLVAQRDALQGQVETLTVKIAAGDGLRLAAKYVRNWADYPLFAVAIADYDAAQPKEPK